MRRRGIDHPHVRVFDESDRLLGGGIGQAQNHDAGVIYCRFAGANVLPVGVRQLHNREVGPHRQPLPNLQSGRAGGAVDEDFLIHDSHLPTEMRAGFLDTGPNRLLAH